MLLLLTTLFLCHAVEHEWTEELKQCTNLVHQKAPSADACREACAVDEKCEVYQFYQRRRGGDCYLGEYDESKCHLLHGQRNKGQASAGGVKVPQEECDVVRAECCGYIRDYDLVPHKTWGRMPRPLRGEWQWKNCNEVAGGPEMPNCPYTCEGTSMQQAASVAVVTGESETPMVVNVFALVGVASLLYGAGKHFFGKQKSQSVEIEM